MNQQVEQAELKYRTPLYPIVPIVAFSLNFLTFVSLAFIPDQRIALYCWVPFVTFYTELKFRKVVTFEQKEI